MVKLRPIGQGGIDGIIQGDTMAGIQQTRSIRRGDGFAFIRFGHSAFGASCFAGGVYQKRVTGYNRYGRNPERVRRAYYVRVRYYRPTNPNTPAQQTNRNKFKAAMEGWQALDPAEKQEYRKRAQKLSTRGYCLYISEYMRYN